MGESSNICLSCGSCCDGTLIGFVQLETEERSKLRVLMEIEEVDQKGFFFQPCKNLGCDGCKIYSKRPQKCGEFECGILKSVEAKELDFESALDVITLLKQKRGAIEEKLAALSPQHQSQSFYFKVLKVRSLFRKDKSRFSLSEKHKNLLSEIQELDQLVSQYFGISY